MEGENRFAGLAFHEGKNLWLDSWEDANKLWQHRDAVQQRMAAQLSEVAELSNEVPYFEARF